MTISTVAALQIGSSPKAKPARWNTCSHSNPRSRRRRHAGGHARGAAGRLSQGRDLRHPAGLPLPEGREAYARYHDNAIDVPGPETEALAGLSRRTGASLVVGVIERGGSTLYCTALYFDPSAGLVAKHRKLMPTGTERLIWGQGDGSTLPVVDTPAGRVGGAICWENHMPPLRAAMYAKGVQIWCAPTVDERDIWQCSMRHIAHEGRCFVISACRCSPRPPSWAWTCRAGTASVR